MSEHVYIDFLPGLLRAALVIDDRLDKLLILRDDMPILSGNQYVGRIDTIDKGLAAAFVDVGLQRPGFLSLGDIPKTVTAKGVSEGTYLGVEVVREAFDGKGPRLRARDFGVFNNSIQQLKICDPLGEWLSKIGCVPESIEVTDSGIAQNIKRYISELKWGGTELKLALGNPNLFEANGLEEALEELLNVEVALSSGGSLLVEQGRTLTAIDVNKGSMQSNSGAEELHLKLNLEAAKEISRQLQLRNISGRILIDFPFMKSSDNRKKLQAAFKGWLKEDGVSHKLLPLYMTGLQELTRKRAGHSLNSLVLRPVGIGGLGQEMDFYTVAMKVLREFWCQSVLQTKSISTIIAPSKVLDHIEGSSALLYVEQRVGRSVRLEMGPDIDDLVEIKIE